MAEDSLPWGGITTGDAGPYSDDNWSDAWGLFFQNLRASQGVLDTYLNELIVTGAATPIEVATGAGVVDGKLYTNSAIVQINIPTPAVSTRIDRIVLRKSWAAQTVRITRIAGAEGGIAPALVQIDGTTWDVPLAQVSITTGGVITITDERENLVSNIRAGGINRPSTELTLASGAITVTQFAHSLQPEAGNTDDLDDINGLIEGDFGVFHASDPGTDTITFKHGTGNISCFGGSDINLSEGAVMYFYDGTTVYVAGGGGGGAAGTSSILTSMVYGG
jgi:hypothetical protein